MVNLAMLKPDTANPDCWPLRHHRRQVSEHVSLPAGSDPDLYGGIPSALASRQLDLAEDQNLRS